MKSFKWKIYDGSDFIDSGSIQAENQRDAMGEVLLANKGKVKADRSYAITVGDATMSSYGDEFERSARVNGYGDDAEQEKMEGAHHFKPKIGDVIKNLTESTKKMIETLGAVAAKCPGSLGRVHDMNDTVINPTTGEYHARCYLCGFIDPQGTGNYGHRGTDAYAKVGIVKNPCLPVWDNQLSDPMQDVLDAAKKMRDGPKGIPYPHVYKGPDLSGGIIIKNGEWTDGFSSAEVRKIMQIATLHGLDPCLIEGAIQVPIGWKFGCSDGRNLTISDEMIKQ